MAHPVRLDHEAGDCLGAAVLAVDHQDAQPGTRQQHGGHRAGATGTHDHDIKAFHEMTVGFRSDGCIPELGYLGESDRGHTRSRGCTRGAGRARWTGLMGTYASPGCLRRP